MSKKRRHKAKRKPVRAIRTATAKGESYRGREIGRDILKGVVFIAIAFGIKLAIEHTTVGQQMQWMSYNLLQLQLPSASLPVTIVDISDLPAKDTPVGAEMVTATPRDTLKELLNAIAEQRPKAIGIDIDFSPDEGQLLPDDPQFFQHCLDLREKNGVPVFLGVHRTIAEPSEKWLGERKFEPLAANILIPNDSKRMLNLMTVHEGNAFVSEEEKSKPSRSMSALLAGAYGEGDTTPWIHGLLTQSGLVERFTEREIAENLSVQDFPIDYGSVDDIIPIHYDTVLQRSRNDKPFAGKLVLIGDATLGTATDTFVIPARNKPYPGVFLHASAAYTLIKAPLYDLTHSGHIILDLLLSGIVLLGVVLIKFRYKQIEMREAAAEKARGLLTLLVVFAGIVIGVVFVRTTRVLWDDFFLALILLVFHPSIEHHGEKLWAWIKRRILHLGNRLPAGHERATSLKNVGLLLLFSAVVTLTTSSGVKAQENPVAIIEKITGVVILKHEGKQIRLKPETDMARRLYAGDSVYCTKGAKLSLRIGGKETKLDENSKWFQIPTQMSPDSETQRALNAYGRIGGRKRGGRGKSTLFSPADESAVSPELFTIRWAPPARKNCVAAIDMQGRDGKVLWQEKNIDVATGKFDSEKARQALATYRTANMNGSIRLNLTDSCGNASHSDFKVLSIDDENSLKEELRFWDCEPESWMKHLGRASVFSQYQMYSEVADEYEQALALLPSSRDLLSRTAEAQHAIGNLSRAKELARRRK